MMNLNALALPAAAAVAVVGMGVATPAHAQVSEIQRVGVSSLNHATGNTAGASAMQRPVDTTKTSAKFGQAGSNWSSGHHTGLDFVAPVGAKVYAAQAGKVVEAGTAGAYGNSIVIDHGHGLKTRYAHLSKIDVKVGQKVTVHQLIGLVGATGNVTGPHLHFEVIKKGTPVDPQKYLVN